MIDEKKINLKTPDKIEQMRKIVLDAIEDKKKVPAQNVGAQNLEPVQPHSLVIKQEKIKKVMPKKIIKKNINILENKMPKAKKIKKETVIKQENLKKEVIEDKKVISVEPAKKIVEIKKEKKVVAKDIIAKPKELKKEILPIKKEIKPLIIKKPTIVVKPKKKYPNKILVIVLLLLIILGAVIMFFSPKSENRLSLSLSNYIPFPAMVIDGEYISFKKFVDETNKVQLYLDRQKSRGIINELPPRKEVKENIKKYFIRQHVMNELANQYKVTVSKEEIKTEIEKLKSQLRSEDTIEKVLKDVYGWNLADFENKIIKPYVLGVKISKIIFKDTTDLRELNTKWENLIKQSEKQMNVYVLIK
jgi:hypothetical protein